MDPEEVAKLVQRDSLCCSPLAPSGCTLSKYHLGLFKDSLTGEQKYTRVICWKIRADSPVQTLPLEQPGTTVPLAASTVSRPRHAALSSVGFLIQFTWLFSRRDFLRPVWDAVACLDERRENFKVGTVSALALMRLRSWDQEAKVCSWFHNALFQGWPLEKEGLGDSEKWVLPPRRQKK